MNHSIFDWLQLFGEDSGADASGDTAAVAGQQENPQTDQDKPSWEQIMADPDYNRQMQKIIQSRLREAKGAAAALETLSPALEIMAQRYGLDPKQPDYAALAQAIRNDGSARQNENAMRRHFDRLTFQARLLQKEHPGFDLGQELKNSAFSRLVAPGVGVSVRDAFHAVHHQELMRKTARLTAERLSQAIRSGSYRPDEAGASGQGASVTTFDYRQATPEQRMALKRRIREASAKGEKLYPGFFG